MSRTISCGIAVLILVTLSAGPAGEANKSTTPPTREQLEARVETLQTRVRELERRNSALEAEAQQLRTRLLVERPQPIIPDAGRVPENWQRRQFNGITYYLVPLEMTTPTTRPSR